MAKRIKKLEARILSIRYLCPTANEDKVVGPEGSSFASTSQDCEMCGSHGNVEVNINCPCGKWHKIELSSW